MNKILNSAWMIALFFICVIASAIAGHFSSKIIQIFTSNVGVISLIGSFIFGLMFPVIAYLFLPKQNLMKMFLVFNLSAASLLAISVIYKLASGESNYQKAFIAIFSIWLGYIAIVKSTKNEK